MIYTLFSSWGPKQVPTRISDIAIFVGTFFSPHEENSSFCPYNEVLCFYFFKKLILLFNKDTLN